MVCESWEQMKVKTLARDKPLKDYGEVLMCFISSFTFSWLKVIILLNILEGEERKAT